GIGDELETQPQPALLTGLAGIGAARRAIGGGFEMRVAEAAIAAARHSHLFSHPGEIGSQCLIVFFEDLRAGGKLEHEVGSVGAGPLLAHAMAAGPGLEVLVIAIVDQRVQSVDGFDPHIAAPATVATVGSTELDELLAPEADGAFAAVSRAHIDLRL